MNHKQEAKDKRDNGLCTFLGDNILVYEADVAFQTIALKTIADYAITTKAAAAAAADNTGYSVDKLAGKNAAGALACQLCASSQVKLDILGNNAVSQSLNSSISFYTKSSDAKSASRLQNVHDVMKTNLALITTTYLTEADLDTLQVKINTYTGFSGSTTSVHTGSPVLTKALADAFKVGASDVLTIKKLAKKYITINSAFYYGLMNACKIPAITVRHTPVTITITDSITLAPVANVKGTLSKTKELGIGTPDGIINYTNVLAGAAISTYSHTGYITGVQSVRIKRGKKNTFVYALVPGVMTFEMEALIDLRINAFNVAEEAKKAAKAANAKARKDAKAKLLVVSG